jgi:hypothetical protein
MIGRMHGCLTRSEGFERPMYNVSGLLNVARQPQTGNESQLKDHIVYFLVCASPDNPGLAAFNSPDTL